MKELQRKAFSLVETIVALCVAGCILPALLGAFGTVLLSNFRNDVMTDRVFGAEWWFNRLSRPVSRAAVAAMPKTDVGGKLRFVWNVEDGEHGALWITLYVSDGCRTDVPFVMCRAY